jgi:hypothetical protein
MTRLLCSLHTLEAVLSGDSPMLASGWLPPFPGGDFVSHRVPAKNFHFDQLIVSFLSGFSLALYAGLRPCALRAEIGLEVPSPRDGTIRTNAAESA